MNACAKQRIAKQWNSVNFEVWFRGIGKNTRILVNTVKSHEHV